MSKIDLTRYRPNVGLMIINKDGLVLCGERYNIPDAWQMPQGGIDAGETPEQAAWRELEEETGITQKDVKLMGQHPEWLYYTWPPEWKHKIKHAKNFDGQRQLWFSFQLTNANADPLVSNFKSDEFKHFKWANYDWLLSKTHDVRKENYKKLKHSLHLSE